MFHYQCSFLLSFSPRLLTLWGCCLTSLAVSTLSSVTPLHSLLSFLPLLLSTEIKAHTVEAFISSPKNSPGQKRSDFPPEPSPGWMGDAGVWMSSREGKELLFTQPHKGPVCWAHGEQRTYPALHPLQGDSFPYNFSSSVLCWRGEGVTENKAEKGKKKKLKEKGEWIWLKLAANRSMKLASLVSDLELIPSSLC